MSKPRKFIDNGFKFSKLDNQIYATLRKWNNQKWSEISERGWKAKYLSMKDNYIFFKIPKNDKAYASKKLFADKTLAVEQVAVQIDSPNELSKNVSNGKGKEWFTPSAFWFLHEEEEEKESEGNEEEGGLHEQEKGGNEEEESKGIEEESEQSSCETGNGSLVLPVNDKPQAIRDCVVEGCKSLATHGFVDEPVLDASVCYRIAHVQFLKARRPGVQIVQQLTAIAAIGRWDAGAAIAKAQLTKADLEVAKKEKKRIASQKFRDNSKKKAKRYATGK